MQTFQDFGKIRTFKQALRALKRSGQDMVQYTATVKLHGTNAGVYVDKTGAYVPQSRRRSLTIEQDNFGFAAFALRSKVREHITAHAHDIMGCLEIGNVTLFGEWVGPGIQQNVGINKIPQREFVLFGAGTTKDGEFELLSCRPEVIASGSVYPELRVRCICEIEPLFFELYANDHAHNARVHAALLKRVEAIDARCPWAAMHGIDGHGEGLVCTPLWITDPELRFKLKGTSHVATGAPKRQRKADQSAAVYEFVGRVITGARLEQGARELAGLNGEQPPTMRQTGDFLAWIRRDVAEEHAQDLADLGLEFAQVRGALDRAAVDFWKKLCSGA